MFKTIANWWFSQFFSGHLQRLKDERVERTETSMNPKTGKKELKSLIRLDIFAVLTKVGEGLLLLCGRMFPSKRISYYCRSTFAGRFTSP